MEILVCIGSGCHVRGSYGIMNQLKTKVTENNLDSSIRVRVAFCLGICKQGVTIKIDDKHITGVTNENVDEIFYEYVIKPLKNDKSD